MKNLMKTGVMTAALAVSGMALADAANVLIAFESMGPDCYADGTTVLDGERYALVWTADGSFDGFKTDGTAAAENEKVLLTAPLAKGGRCPMTVFQVDSKVAPHGGSYYVYLLDTRTTATELSKTMVVTGAAEAKGYGAASGTANVASVKTDKTADLHTTTAPVAGLASVAAPVITAIRVEGATVTITASNIFPGLKYSIRGGLDKATEVTVPAYKGQEGSTVNFVLENPEAKFFSIKAE